MQYQDYYQTLGVSKQASDEELKRAFRDLAKKYHPDVNQGDKTAEKKFKEINEAYEVLKDKQKRARYDQVGSSYKDWQQQGGSSSNYNWNEWFSGVPSSGGYARPNSNNGDMGGFSDFFSQIFGNTSASAHSRTTSGGARRGRSAQIQEHEVIISLTEAFHGTQRQLSTDGKSFEVKIPAGAKTGTKIRMAGVMNGADLILLIKTEDDPIIERKENDLYMDVFVDLYTAILGGETAISVFDDKFLLKIPDGTQQGQRIRLSGKGMPKLNRSDDRGDLFVRINVLMPKSISAEERRIFETLRELQN